MCVLPPASRQRPFACLICIGLMSSVAVAEGGGGDSGSFASGFVAGVFFSLPSSPPPSFPVFAASSPPVAFGSSVGAGEAVASVEAFLVVSAGALVVAACVTAAAAFSVVVGATVVTGACVEVSSPGFLMFHAWFPFVLSHFFTWTVPMLGLASRQKLDAFLMALHVASKAQCCIVATAPWLQVQTCTCAPPSSRHRPSRVSMWLSLRGSKSHF
mmetsp:Transcript_25266/g.57367  ORF Transcript_25266/g.57367 Transcript_25266/m.57367 type:complete len:214 (+) Transcript_25266:1669-2310(+)